MVDYKSQYFATCDAVYESWKSCTSTLYDESKKFWDNLQIRK